MSVHRPRLLLIDNYDSFTWNVVQGLGALGAAVDVVPNDDPTLGDRLDGNVGLPIDGVVVSPGPGTPDRAGDSVAAIRRVAGRLPTLGICLGHQALAVAFGGTLRPAATIMHGKTSLVSHLNTGALAGLPQPFEAMRYHSLAVDRDTLPPDLEVTAWTSTGEVMAIRHRRWDMEGVQFHPESVGTPAGPGLLANFVKRVRGGAQRSAA